MTRKALVLSVVLVAGLVWPAAVLAQNPNTCLPTCYAWNHALSDGNGTAQSPWLWETEDDVDDLVDLMIAAVQGRRNFGTLQVIECSDANPDQCVATLFTFTRAGGEPVITDLGVVPVPEVGVPLPFYYILIFAAIVAVLLVGVGVLMRRRAHQMV